MGGRRVRERDKSVDGREVHGEGQEGRKREEKEGKKKHARVKTRGDRERQTKGTEGERESKRK